MIGYILFGIAWVGFYTWFGTKKESQVQGNWENEKIGAYMLLAVWIALLIFGLYLM
jgi:hypothetical protein